MDDDIMSAIREFILRNYMMIGVVMALFLLLVLAMVVEQIKKHTEATREVAAEVRALRHMFEADIKNSQQNPPAYVPQYKTDAEE